MSSRQNLPIPLGGLAPVHVRASSLVRVWRGHASQATALLGLGLAISASLLSVFAAPVAVYGTATVVHFADATLLRSHPLGLADARVYTGDVALVIKTRPDGTIRAAAVSTLAGQPAKGSCTMTVSRDAAMERCEFSLGARRLASVDRYDPASHVWRRRFRDGAQAQFAVPTGAALVPIPLPLGHS